MSTSFGTGLTFLRQIRLRKPCQTPRKLPIQFSRSISVQQAFLRLFGRTDFGMISAGSTCRYLETAPRRRLECPVTNGESRACLAYIFWVALAVQVEVGFFVRRRRGRRTSGGANRNGLA